MYFVVNLTRAKMYFVNIIHKSHSKRAGIGFWDPMWTRMGISMDWLMGINWDIDLRSYHIVLGQVDMYIYLKESTKL